MTVETRPEGDDLTADERIERRRAAHRADRNHEPTGDHPVDERRRARREETNR